MRFFDSLLCRKCRVRIATTFAFQALISVVAFGSQEIPKSDFPLNPPANYVTDVDRSERVQETAQQALSSTLVTGLRNFDWLLVEEAFTDDFLGRFPDIAHGTLVDDDTLEIFRYDLESEEVLRRDEMVSRLRAQARHWISVERSSWKMFEFLLEPGGDGAIARAHMQLGGPDQSGGRSVVDSTVTVQLAARNGEKWKIRRLDATDVVRVHNPTLGFRDITDAVGLHFNRSAANQQLRQDVADTGVSHIDSALSVVDWNRDGFWDIVATESGNHSVLFLNDGRGGFVRRGLPVRNYFLTPGQLLFVDLDGDGLEELVGSRIVYSGDRGWIGLYTRRAGDWIFLSRALEFENPVGVRWNETQMMTAGDVNGDGLLDLFIGGYQTNRSGTAERFNRVDADDGSDNLLFINQGELRFTEESDLRGITGTRHTYVAEFFDFDDDGDLDLFEGNDFGSNVVWDNQGNGMFRALDQHPLATDASYTMGVTIADWDNTGAWSVYLSNMYSHAGQRVVRLTDSVSEEMHARLEMLSRGNQLFSLEPETATWVERSGLLGINEAGWAWGSLFYDVDNDGDKDVFVTNGNTSYGERGAPDL